MNQTTLSTVNAIRENAVIAIIRGVSNQQILPLLNALYQGGIRVAEITFGYFDDQTTAQIIQTAINAYGDKMCLGAGTVLSAENANTAISLGAKYLVSPVYDEQVVNSCLSANCVMICGAFTPTEINNAYKRGAQFVKLFPANAVGVEYLKSVKAPLPNVPIIAFGGITASNLPSYLKAGAVGVGVGNELVNLTAINNGDFNYVTTKAKELVNAVNQAKSN